MLPTQLRDFELRAAKIVFRLDQADQVELEYYRQFLANKYTTVTKYLFVQYPGDDFKVNTVTVEALRFRTWSWLDVRTSSSYYILDIDAEDNGLILFRSTSSKYTPVYRNNNKKLGPIRTSESLPYLQVFAAELSFFEALRSFTKTPEVKAYLATTAGLDIIKMEDLAYKYYLNCKLEFFEEHHRLAALYLPEFSDRLLLPTTLKVIKSLKAIGILITTIYSSITRVTWSYEGTKYNIFRVLSTDSVPADKVYLITKQAELVFQNSYFVASSIPMLRIRVHALYLALELKSINV